MPFYNTTAGIEAFATNSSKYIFLGSELNDDEFDAEVVSKVSTLDQTTTTYDMLVTRGPNGASNLICVLVIYKTAEGTSQTVYLSEQQLAGVSRNADGFEYEAYVGDTGKTITINAEKSLAENAAPGFYKAMTDRDGITTLTSFGHNASTGVDKDILRQNMGILGLAQGRNLICYNVSDGVNDGNSGLGTQSAGAMVVVDVRTEEEVEASQTGRLTSSAQMFDLMERDPSRVVIADLYVSQSASSNPVVDTIYVKKIVRGTPGLGTVIYSAAALDPSAETGKMIVVKNNAGTDMGRVMQDVPYSNIIGDVGMEGFFTYCVNASGGMSLERLTLENATAGLYGMHNQVTAIDVEAGTMSTRNIHICDAGCCHDNEAPLGELTITEETQVFDARGNAMDLDQLAAMFDLTNKKPVINYYCSGVNGARTVDLIFVVDQLAQGLELHDHNCDIDHGSDSTVWLPLSSITDTMTATTDLKSGNYYLDKDITLKDNCYLYTYGGVTVNLCLNGKELRGADGKEYILNAKGDSSVLNICDCSTEKSGTIGQDWRGVGEMNSRAAILINGNNCQVNLYAGSITGIQKAGSVVYVKAGNEFNMYGGFITGNNVDSAGAVHVLGTFNITGGQIKDNTVAGDKQVTGTGTINITEGTVTENPTPVVPPATGHDHTCSQDTHDWSELTGWTALSTVTTGMTGAKELPAGNYYLDDDITIPNGYLQIKGKVNLCLNGHNISGASSYYIFGTHASGAEFNICDCSPAQSGTIGKGWTGSSTGTRAYGVIRVGTSNSVTNSTVNLYGGSITGATNGSIVYVQQNNTFNMYGGSMYDNIPKASISEHDIDRQSSLGKVFIYGGEFDRRVPDAFIPDTHEIKTGGTHGFTVVKRTQQ